MPVPAASAAVPAAQPASAPASASVSLPPATAARERRTNAAKQAKFIIGGGLPAWYLNVPGHVWACVASDTGPGAFWTRPLAYYALAAALATVLLLAYVLLLPARGHKLNYAQWHEDPRLRSLIPQLTLTIVTGHVALLLLLSPLGGGGGIPPPPYGWSPPALLHWASDALVNRQLTQVHFWAWARALVGSTTTYLFLFGLVGLLKSILPPASHARSAHKTD